MINNLFTKRMACSVVISTAIILVFGAFADVLAQRDPFAKPGFMRPRTPPTGSTASAPKSTTPAKTVNYGPPSIEARIEYFKQIREAAALNGEPLPKVTSVLTLSEMSVTGIFKTPRGYAAMVEATPIKLSYTIYPGEKFFDGQLVAVEENKLVFRKVTKVGDGKFVASVENMPLRQFSMKAQIEGTAPDQPNQRPVEVAKTETTDSGTKKPAGNPFLSPLDEMMRQPAEPNEPKTTPKKAVKKPVKIARKN